MIANFKKTPIFFIELIRTSKVIEGYERSFYV